MSHYECSTCGIFKNTRVSPPVSSKDGLGCVCPDCDSKDEVQEGHLEELRLQASEPQLNGLGEE